MRPGGFPGLDDRLDDNIGKPRHARELWCGAFRIANSADLLFAPAPPERAEPAAEQQLELEDGGDLGA